MSHVPHELEASFPEFRSRIDDLKASDAHFRRLYDDYHVLNREIHRIEAAGLNTSDEEYEKLKFRRLTLRDDLYRLMRG